MGDPSLQPERANARLTKPWHVFVFLAGLLTVSGCFGTADGDVQLPIVKFDAWQMPSEESKLPTPRGMFVAENGDLYVLDDAGRFLIYDRDHKLTRKTWMPEYSIGRAEGLWQMLDGRVAVADTHYNRVVLLNPDGSCERMFGTKGTGPGEFTFPETVVQDPQGRLYVCEYGGNDRIQRFSANGEFQIAFSSFGTDPGQLQRPTGLVWHDHKIYVCDAVNNRVQRFSEDGQFEAVLADAQTAGLYYPYDMAISPTGELYVAEFGSGRVTKLSLEGKLLGRYGTAGRSVGQFWTPWGVAVAPDGRVFVADTGNRRLVELKL
jgi:iron(III) transport system ATP-binding protein